jgi:acyl-coenzyme A synthetase/AMP-(fatty) acid ligase
MTASAPLHVQDYLNRYAVRFPDKVQIQDVDLGDAVTWSEGRDWADRVAQLLHVTEITAQDRVVVVGTTSVESVLLFYSVLRYGAVLCPVDYDSNALYLDELLARVRPRLILWQRGLAEASLASIEAYPNLAYGRVAEAEFGADELFDRLRAMNPATELPCIAKADSPSVILFTSGTSSKPKAPVHSQRSFMLVSEAGADQWEVTSDDRLLDYRSFAWASTIFGPMMPSLLRGATLLVTRKFSRTRFFSWIEQYRPTIVAGVPAVINILLNADADAKHPLQQVRFISSSTAPLSVERLQEFEGRYGIPIVEHYGMSEAGCIAGNRPSLRKAGTTGLPHANQNLQILSPSAAVLERGETGEIVVRGPQNVCGTLNESGEIEPLPSKELRTGDLGFIDADGFLHVTGRLKEIIIKGGVNVAPDEIDAVLLRHGDVGDAAAIGVPDPIYGEEIVCYVVAKSSERQNAGAILEHCQRFLPAAKHPRSLHFIDAIPRSGRGKIDRNALKARWAKSRTGSQDDVSR